MLRRKKEKSSSYDLWKLVDARQYEDLGQCSGSEQIICDIDKTYLETSFDSWTKMARIAFEAATDKITVPGASEVLIAARWGEMELELDSELEKSLFPRPLHFVSASPPQLRSILEEKLMIDGLDWSSDTFKNQVYNIRKRQFSLLRQQVSYKTAAILKLMESQADSTSYYLIGDNAESDPYIYLGIKLLIERQLGKLGFQQYLGFMGVESSQVDILWRGLTRIPHGKVKGIFIRKLKTGPSMKVFSKPVPIIEFHSFYEVGINFYLSGLIGQETLWTIIKNMHNRHGLALSDARLALLACSHQNYSEKIHAEIKDLISRIKISADSQSGPSRFTPVEFSEDEFTHLSESEVLDAAKQWATGFREKVNEEHK